MHIDDTAPEEDFDNAFSSFAVDDAPPAAPPVEGEAPVAGDPPAAPADAAPAADAVPAADPPADGAAVVADPSAAADPAAAAPAPAAAPSADQAPVGPSGEEILESLKKLVGSAPAAEPAPVAEKPPFNSEETEFLAKYEEDWADVSKGEALKRRAEYDHLVSHIFKQVIDYVKPMQETTELLATRTHLSDINGAVPDYNENLRDQVTGWVKTQPAYLQPAYDHVIQKGTVEEVKDLVDRYRGATGAATTGVVAAPIPAPKAPELSDAAKKAAAALAPVESKRSGVQAPGDPSNFDDAWGQFATEKV